MFRARVKSPSEEGTQEGCTSENHQELTEGVGRKNSSFAKCEGGRDPIRIIFGKSFVKASYYYASLIAVCS